MFKIGKLFHMTHVVTDLAAVDKWYDDVFGATRFYRGYEKLAGRDASLIAIGNVVMEPMQPAKVANLLNPSVKKFHDRFGQHFHSIAWYVDDVVGISTQLDKHGLRQFNISGKVVKAGEERHAVWTHPKESHGQLEFAEVVPFSIDPRLQPAWSSEYWSARHPLGIERSSHINVTARDLTAAKRLFCEALNGKLIHEEEHAGHKRSAFVAVGEDTVVELAQPLSSTCPEAQDMEQNGEGTYALFFKTRNLSQANDFLKSKGLKPEPSGPDSIALGKDQAFGMVIGFTQRSIPNDPR